MRVRRCSSQRWRCARWCVAFANCESETVAILVADVFRPRCASGRSCSVPARDRAVQRGRNRVRCGRLRRHARARPDRDEACPAWRWWCPLSAQTCACELREGLAANRRLHRRSSSDCDAGASRCQGAEWIPASGHPGDGCSFRSIDPHDKIPLTRRDRSAPRDPRRRLARVGIHPVRRGDVPSGTRRGPGGTPA